MMPANLHCWFHAWLKRGPQGLALPTITIITNFFPWPLHPFQCQGEVAETYSQRNMGKGSLKGNMWGLGTLFKEISALEGSWHLPLLSPYQHLPGFFFHTGASTENPQPSPLQTEVPPTTIMSHPSPYCHLTTTTANTETHFCMCILSLQSTKAPLKRQQTCGNMANSSVWFLRSKKAT